MSTSPDPFDEVVLDEDFIAGGVKEPDAEERLAKARRIARSNDRLQAAGEIADGSGKPRYSRVHKSTPWIALGAAVAIAIVVIAIVVR